MRTRSVQAVPFVAILLALFGQAGTAAGQQTVEQGRAIYERQCAACHAGGDPRAPALSTLQSRNAADLRHALTVGIMAQQASNLSEEERSALIAYLAAVDVEHEVWISDMMCTPAGRRVELAGTRAMTSVGIDPHATRMMPAELAGLTKGDLERLELAWVIAFPGITGLRAAPVIVGNTMFYSAEATRKVLAIDTDTGCAKWAYDAGAPLRSSVTLGRLGANGPEAIVFTDGRGRVHAVEAETGREIWVVDGQADEGQGMLTGSPVIHEDRIVIPVSASGVTAASNPNFECCIGRGAVVMLDARSGDRLWTYYTMEEAQYTGEVNSLGVRLRGPSGAPIWTTPTIDAKRNRVYVTTGENTSHPATETSDAVIALDIDTGEALWIFQATPQDVWNMACTGRNGPNCPRADESILQDWDFGGSAILTTLPDGRELLLAGQKSGHLWALNPEDGSVVWYTRVGEGGALGGNHWGIAIDGQRVFLPINDPLPNGAELMPGIYAFDIATGEPVWQHRMTADCSGGRQEIVPQCQSRYGLSAAPLVVDGAVITAATDGRMLIFDGETGRILFQYDTAQRFTGINGVEGNGGAVDSHSIGAGAGMVFIGSGYGQFGQARGNVLLAFRPRR